MDCTTLHRFDWKKSIIQRDIILLYFLKLRNTSCLTAVYTSYKTIQVLLRRPTVVIEKRKRAKCLNEMKRYNPSFQNWAMIFCVCIFFNSKWSCNKVFRLSNGEYNAHTPVDRDFLPFSYHSFLKCFIHFFPFQTLSIDSNWSDCIGLDIGLILSWFQDVDGYMKHITISNRRRILVKFEQLVSQRILTFPFLLTLCHDHNLCMESDFLTFQYCAERLLDPFFILQTCMIIFFCDLWEIGFNRTVSSIM